jgi:hypothetical protein
MILDAAYSTQGLPTQYHNNPLIECLPQILSPIEVVKTLTNRPSIDLASSRQQPPYLRLHDIATLEELYVPHPDFITLESELSITLRRSLLRRDPFAAETQRYLDDLRQNLRQMMRHQGAFSDPLASCLLLTALSGSGKTRGVRNVLKTYPQVIRHNRYKGKPFRQHQIVWLSVDAPVSGSIRGLLLRLFHALDTALKLNGDQSYLRQFGRTRTSYDVQIEHFAQAAASHFVGVIHIDDLQRIWEAKRTQRDIIFSFIIQLANAARIPLILSGTPPMTRLLANSLEAARRSVSGCAIQLTPPKDASDKFFDSLLTALFRYQWVDKGLVLSGDEKIKFHFWTQGIPGIMVLLYIVANKLAVRAGGKELLFSHFEIGYRMLSILHPSLEALQSKSRAAQMRYQDLLPTKAQMIKALKELNSEKLDVEDLMNGALEQIW